MTQPGAASSAKPHPVVIVNPNSAGGQTRRRWFRYESLLGEVLGNFEQRFTERPGHATELAREALRQGHDTIIGIGGDGTLNELVNGFFDGREVVRPGAAFAILPAGTGGDFPKTTGTPRDFENAARGLKGATRHPIDVGRMTYLDHDGKERLGYFINICSFGIGGLVDRYVNRSSKALGGKLSFMLATARAGIAFKNQRVRITLDEGEESESSFEASIRMVAVANGKFFGGGMKVAPDALLDDGLFDVVSVDASSTAMLMALPKVYSGTHIGSPYVKAARARTVRAESLDGEEVLLDMDGEQPGRLPARFEVVSGAVQVLY